MVGDGWMSADEEEMVERWREMKVGSGFGCRRRRKRRIGSQSTSMGGVVLQTRH